MKNLVFILLTMSVVPLQAQYDNQAWYSGMEDQTWFWGGKAGINISTIEDVKSTIIPTVFSEDTYTTVDSSAYGFTGGFFFYHRFYNSQFAVQPELGYSQLGGYFNYSDIQNLNYRIGFLFDYFTINSLVKIYPLKGAGLHVSLGPQIGIIANTTNLKYNSNKPELGPDLQIQDNLRQVLKGKNTFALLFGAGYDMEFESFGLVVEVRYVRGFSDVLETFVNGFNFIETKNRNTAIQASIGVLIPFE